jgi:hypothetical protein
VTATISMLASVGITLSAVCPPVAGIPTFAVDATVQAAMSLSAIAARPVVQSSAMQ